MLYPNELQALQVFPFDQVLVGAEGFEPPTPCSQSRCATKLRYAPKKWLAKRFATRDGDDTQDPYFGQLHDLPAPLANCRNGSHHWRQINHAE